MPAVRTARTRCDQHEADAPVWRSRRQPGRDAGPGCIDGEPQNDLALVGGQLREVLVVVAVIVAAAVEIVHGERSMLGVRHRLRQLAVHRRDRTGSVDADLQRRRTSSAFGRAHGAVPEYGPKNCAEQGGCAKQGGCAEQRPPADWMRHHRDHSRILTARTRTGGHPVGYPEPWDPWPCRRPRSAPRRPSRHRRRHTACR